MKENKDIIKAELKALIDKSNAFLNTGSNKQQTTAYIYVIFSLIALSFFGLFAIGPTVTTISQLNKQYEEDTKALVQLKKKNAALSSLSAQYLDIQPELALIDSSIPQSPKIAELTRQIEYLTVRNNLTVQKLDTGLMELYPAKQPNNPLFSFTFSIGVSGDEEDVNLFLGDLINMGRIIGIERLTTGKQEESIFSANITGRAFFYKQ